MFLSGNLNSRQKKIFRSWPSLLWDFARREWVALLASATFGVVIAELVHLLWWDEWFQCSLVARYYPDWISSDDPGYYAPFLAIMFFLLLLASAPAIFVGVRRGIRSWLHGVTSGLVLLPFVSAVAVAISPVGTTQRRLTIGFLLGALWFALSFCLFLLARVRAARTVGESECTVPASLRSLARSQLDWSDDPIQTWAQDALGRAALVDSLSVKIMVAKAPVIALTGRFGAGKTSLLNLLREHLGDTTITVSFSSWLPGSQETLTAYLLADIASECRKQYVVPDLRQSARRLAMALGQKVPFLSNYLRLLPAPTQKDQIDNLKSALTRIPKRVVVLLDEIDRMDKEELLTLLKVIRGISTLPNLSFVCAGDRPTIVETVKGECNDKNNAYFEKFFPVAIPIPEPDPAGVRKAGVERLVATFAGRDWFEGDSEKQKFQKQIEALWDDRIAPFCHNLRTVGLLANDVSVAAAQLRREVDPVDLTLVELLRRFRLAVYELVAKNSIALTGGETLVRGGPLLDEKSEEKNANEFLAKLKGLLPREEDFEQVEGILRELFPMLSKAERKLYRMRPKRRDDSEDDDKRIRWPGIFPAYFRYELPDAIFSSVEMSSLLQQFESAGNQAARQKVFLDTLHSMEKGSLKRDDFLRKLADFSRAVPAAVAKQLGEVAAKASAQYTFDMMPAFGEAGHVLRMILAVAKRLPQSERVAFLRACVLNASADTMAFNIVRFLTKQKDEENLSVSEADLFPSFATRMRARYGRNVDAENIDLSTSDPWALDYWGRDLRSMGIASDPEDRKIQNDFWLRYIGASRPRLAKAFREFFLPVAAYSEDPAPLVANRISLSDLQRLFETLPDDPNLTSRERDSLNTLRRFLAGEFKNGISPVDTDKLYSE